jgi:hypothetical protein
MRPLSSQKSHVLGYHLEVGKHYALGMDTVKPAPYARNKVFDLMPDHFI